MLLHGCRSLKEKRRRVGGVRDRFGKRSGLAVAGVGEQDNHQLSAWTFVCAASDPVVVEQTLAEVERYLRSGLDAELISSEQHWW